MAGRARVRVHSHPRMRGVPVLPWRGWLTPPLPRRHCQHNRAQPGIRSAAGEGVGMCWHTFARSAPSPADSTCCLWERPRQHRVGPGTQCAPGTPALGFTAPKLSWEGVHGAQHGRLPLLLPPEPWQGEAARTRTQLEHLGEPGCKHRTQHSAQVPASRGALAMTWSFHPAWASGGEHQSTTDSSLGRHSPSCHTASGGTSVPHLAGAALLALCQGSPARPLVLGSPCP